MAKLGYLLAVSAIVVGAGGAAAGPEPDQPVPAAADPACGDRYRQMYDDGVKAGAAAGAKLDELLYDAAVCYEQAASASAAVTAYRELRARFPTSPVARSALARLARLYARTAQYAEAAAAFEDYARLYAADAQAFAALNDAVYYRKAIGDDDQALADTKLFIKLFGAKRPADAANAFFSMGAIIEKRGRPADTVAHWRAYVKTYGARGGGDKLVIAHARIGDLLWHASCPVKETDGACIRAVRPKPDHQPCGPASRIDVEAVKRDARKVKEAQAALGMAIAVYERAGGKFAGGDEYAARRSYAWARFDVAERDREALLAVAFPLGLDFDPAKPAVTRTSSARFQAWFEEQDRLAARAAAAYRALIVEVKDPSYAIASSARIGQISLHFVDAMLTADIPPYIRSNKDAVQAYCDKLTEVAEPFEAAAVDAFSACLRVSTETGWFSDWSRLCERELARLRPDEFPPAKELRAPPAAASAASAPPDPRATGPIEPGLWGSAPIMP